MFDCQPPVGVCATAGLPCSVTARHLRATAGLSYRGAEIEVALLDKPDSATHCWKLKYGVGSSNMVRAFLCIQRSHGKLDLWLPFGFESRASNVSCFPQQTAAGITRQASCDCVARTQKSGPTLYCRLAPRGATAWLVQPCDACHPGGTVWLVQQCDEVVTSRHKRTWQKGAGNAPHQVIHLSRQSCGHMTEGSLRLTASPLLWNSIQLLKADRWRVRPTGCARLFPG
uniref:Uncharacterized protein n=1 Tax=Rubinisphaera brasiliensis (strain ATCC 49424 / DSM 5305 / JCM 21570 / IAM 15109 / NBRC 103401 / IFAM 1448) TaxID=756272 RepID=F0SGY1_RUBBR|nr:hypothetical protein Plabr_1856 [Rubinisphaera brasiliensis DSM 5305]